ncbi:MAG: phosphoenolpyruvate--protein phosphotransferase [Planctomycetes bacterium]|nr:phosphoenolpyruvate--protein phosphotransferase [Planctomycetota bacterium]
MDGRQNTETRFQGLAVSPGSAAGRVCLFRQAVHEDIPEYRVSGEAKEQERERLRDAMTKVAERLESLKQTVRDRLGPAEAEIFSVQRMILEDPALADQFMAAIDEGRNAEIAVQRTLETYERRLLELESAYHSERAGDIGELKRRLLGELCETTSAFICASEPYCQRGRHRVVVTEELTPALALELDAEDVLGLVTDRGGVTSHAAILARALGIPAVSGIPHVHDLVACGTEVLVNGDTGEVVIWPSAATVERFQAKAPAVPRGPVPPVEALAVMANISLAEEADIARRHLAEGVGLYRTEMEFFAAARLLDEDEQADRYRHVLRAMDGLPATFRLLDLGGDKPSPLFDFPDEENPSLGLRGLRYLLTRPHLLATQARALARASQDGPVRVMYPMVTSLAQFRRARALFDEATAGMAAGRIEHGPMFEVPSAVLEAPALLAEADFASIGSNDLLQYLFVVDRNNEHVADDYCPDQPVFWQVLRDLVRAAAEAGRPLAICGEMAADPQYLGRLIDIGIETVSVSVRLIPGVRRAVGNSNQGRDTS